MEEAIRIRYNGSILAEAVARYAIDPAQLETLPAFESYLYEFQRADAQYVLRLSHSLRRSAALIHVEVDWINFLHRGGAGVARAVASPQGQLVEAIDDGHGGQFLATAFVRAPGTHPRLADLWQPPLAVDYGRLIGRIHALSTRYQVPNPAWARPRWDAAGMMDVARWLPPDDEPVLERHRALMAYLRGLPQDHGYGMIHQDAHGGNFFVDEAGQITLFDFDDCVHGHFIYDIAMVIFYAVVNQPEPEAIISNFLPHFGRGYRQAYNLAASWLPEIPYFLKLREIDLYAVIHRSFDVNAIDNQWVAQFMTGRRQRLVEGIPFLDVDFRTLWLQG